VLTSKMLRSCILDLSPMVGNCIQLYLRIIGSPTYPSKSGLRWQAVFGSQIVWVELGRTADEVVDLR
jgi:hypothetical protein